MGFEAETVWLLIAGFILVSAAYAAQLYLLGAGKVVKARRAFLWQFGWQIAAFCLLLRLLFRGMGSSVENSFAVCLLHHSISVPFCLCRLFWAFSLCCLVRGIRAMMR